MDVGCTYKVVRGAICTLDQDTHPGESDDEWGGGGQIGVRSALQP